MKLPRVVFLTLVLAGTDVSISAAREWYVKPKHAFKNSHPRDILDQLLDIARYKRLKPTATPEMIDRACSAYFADL